ncbi:hypothetical protein SO694_00028041 [Aureococcus anophagefferens]|uniref:Ubiquitin-like domain-containing protein n=1 Tax=Aureococcus anophagefferens TaxID=44056 RepID=A0ABR1FVJ8_AURAN
MATVTLYVSYAAPGGEAPELRVDVPATKTVRSVAKAVAKLVERKHGAAPAGLRLLYAASGDAVDVDATAAAAFATETPPRRPSTRAPPPSARLGRRRRRAAARAKASKPRPSKAPPPPSPRLDGLCVVAANQGLIVRGRSLETARRRGRVRRRRARLRPRRRRRRCAVAGDGPRGLRLVQVPRAAVGENDPLCAAFEHALAEPDGPQASVWVRHGGAEARADAVVAAARAAGPAAWAAARLTDGPACPRRALAPVYVESGGPADGGGPPTCHWDVALRLAADVAAGARARPDARARRRVGRAREAAVARAPGRRRPSPPRRPSSSPSPTGTSRRSTGAAPRALALCARRRRAAREARRRRATPAFPLILGVLAVRDAQFCERLKPPNAPPPPPSAGAATDAELAEIALFAKLTRLPNLLLWPMDAADAAPGR